jgi:hypothetical protein
LDKAAVKKELIRYIGATAFCIVFSVIYEHFSHGVYSQFMLLMYLFPLIGGVLPSALHLLIPTFRCGDQMTRSIWNCAVMTLTFGSAITGVFENIWHSSVPADLCILDCRKFSGHFCSGTLSAADEKNSCGKDQKVIRI